MAQIIRKTSSLSPVTKEVVPATIVWDDDGVYLTKEDEQGKVYRALLETDGGVYRELTADKVPGQIPFQNIQLYISSRCNLDCPACFEARSLFPEPSLQEIASFLSHYKKKYIVLCGREPTMRDDLDEIIKLVNKKNYSVLLTNGLKLADYDYVMSLKEAGLRGIMFSLNGFDDRVFMALNGRELLDIKLQGLENIKKAGLRTSVSVTLMKGVNEDQLQDIYGYCIKNTSFIPELRIRTISDVGRSPSKQQFYLSELLDLACDAAGVSKAAALQEGRFLGEVARTFRMPHLLPKLCTFRFHVLVKGGRSEAIGEMIDTIPRGSSACRYASVSFRLARYYGASLFKKLLLHAGLIASEGSTRLFCIRLKCWPNVYNIDLEEIKKCSGGYYKDDECMSFCLSNILRDQAVHE